MQSESERGKPPLPNPLPEGEGTRLARAARPARLGGRGTFKLILDQNLRSWDGPIGMSIAPSPAGVAKSRLGISIGRPVGNAVKRNRIKRLLREAFRAMRADWPRAYDVVLLVKPHETKSLKDYSGMLNALRVKLCARHQKAKGSL